MNNTGGTGARNAVTYMDRQELSVNGLSAVRAKFQSSGPTLNWGIEYAISKGNQVLEGSEDHWNGKAR